MSTLNLNVEKLDSSETVRYNGPAENRSHGTYTITLHTHSYDDLKIHLSLEALVQLKQRVDAALAHMITH